MTKSFLFLFSLAALLALGLRCVQLDLRPMHTDEAVKAVKIFRPLWEGGGYRYDPDEHHGPTLAYSTLLWGKLTLARDFARWSEDRFRGLTIVFGLGLILLLPLVSDGLGRNATLAAALLTAVSPMMVYYSRDYIHEMLLVFFTFLALAAAWRYSRTRKIEWILLAGAAVGLMQSTKETFVFNLAAAAGAGLLNLRFASLPVKGKTAKPVPAAHLVAGVAAWVVVSVLLFSSFLTHLSGPLDSLKTYQSWSGRAQGATVHVHGWGFYWRRLLFFQVAGGPVWSEGLILVLALFAAWAVFSRREIPGANAPFVRFLVFYTVLLAAIYTALPYKTPWCALGFWHSMILLAGIGAVALLSRLPSPRLKMAAGLVLLTGVGHLAFQAWQSDVKYAADQRNPWTYAQTSPDLLNLVSKVEGIAQISPDGNGVKINIIAPDDDYYPLPWYLRRFGNVDWWDEVPGYSKFSMDGDMDAEALAAKLRGKTNAVSRFLMDSTFAKYAEISCSPLFSLGDIKDLGSFAAKLAQKSDAVSKFLSERMDEKANNALAANRGSVRAAAELEPLLIQNLNAITDHGAIYETNRFQAVKLRPATEEAKEEYLATNLFGLDVVRFNRLLLEDAYPLELSRSEIETILVTNLNQILAGPSLYDSNRFQNIILRPETETLLASHPDGQDLIRLNRKLLEDAYTNEIRMKLQPLEIYRPLTIVSAQLESDIDANKDGKMAGFFALRPGTFLELYVQTNLWSAYLQHPAQ